MEEKGAVFVKPRASATPEHQFWRRDREGIRSMAREQFFVVLREGAWKIQHNGQHSRPYRGKASAIKDAIDQAHAVHQHGGLSQVLIQGEDMTFRAERTYGEDRYPPAS
jgi:Uncharacterized protein conserved in bacteria (DUF2188)